MSGCHKKHAVLAQAEIDAMLARKEAVAENGMATRRWLRRASMAGERYDRG